MHLSIFFSNLQQSTQILCAIISVFLNSTLVYLIISKSSKSIGFYKYLMMYISIFEAGYSILDAWTEPMTHAYGSAFITFTITRNSIFGKALSHIGIIIYTGCFGFSLAIFAVHFFYRFCVIHSNLYEKYIEGTKVISLFIIPLVCGVWLSYLCSLFSPNPHIDDYMRDTMLESYNVTMNDVTYVCFWFFGLDKDGKSEPNFQVFSAILCMTMMICSSMFCVLYFGTKCYRKMNSVFTTNPVKSRLTHSFQKQLFYALVVQTCIPLILMYIPVGILFLTTMFEIQIGFASSVVAISIAIYPAVDPLPNLIIIKDYRRAIERFFSRCMTEVLPQSRSSSQITMDDMRTTP